MNREQLDLRVREVIAEQLVMAVQDVKPESKFIEDLGADSLDLVECLMAAEEEFNLEISDEEAKGIETVYQATEALSKLLGIK